MKAKFRCASVNNFEHGELVSLYPASRADTNAAWAFSTNPIGELKLKVERPEARGQFTPGVEYDIEITRAEVP